MVKILPFWWGKWPLNDSLHLVYGCHNPTTLDVRLIAAFRIYYPADGYPTKSVILPTYG